MAAIDAVSAGSVDTATEQEAEAFRELFKAAVWSWYHQHEDDTLFRKWFFAIRVRDVRVLVEAIVGPEA